MSGIYKDEAENYEINLQKAPWSMGGELQDKFRAAGSFLNAVDWMAETEDTILLIEFKDYNHPLSKIEDREKFYQGILRKYYFSVYYLTACGRLNNKVANYVFIAEAPSIDKIIGKRARNSIKRRLPFDLQEQNHEISNKLIDHFDIVSVSKWNELYPMFPLYKLGDAGQIRT